MMERNVLFSDSFKSIKHDRLYKFYYFNDSTRINFLIPLKTIDKSDFEEGKKYYNLAFDPEDLFELDNDKKNSTTYWLNKLTLKPLTETQIRKVSDDFDMEQFFNL